MLATAYVFVRKNVSLSRVWTILKNCFYRGVAMKVTAVPMKFKWYYKQYSHPSCSISSHTNSDSLRDCGRRKYDRWCSFHLYTSPFLFSHPWTGVCTTQHYHYRTYTVLELMTGFLNLSRLRYAFGYDAPDTGANFFFWFMHSMTLTLHGTHTHTHSKRGSLYVLLQARYMLSYLAAIARLCQD